MRTSGSRALKPKTTAAALFTKLRESISKTTGASKAFAIEAVFPISLIGLMPSYRPLTPSMIPILESDIFIALSNDLII